LEVLIKQTGVYKTQVKGGASDGLLALEAPMGLKRKRTDSIEVANDKSV
jgi:hypothetical protein